MTTERILDELHALRDRIFAQVKQPIQLPEPGLRLDLEARKGSERRQFKHLHQSCFFHREHFFVGCRVKHLYLIDAYIAMDRVENVMGVYMAARSMLELDAFMHEVKTRLQDAARLAETQWLDGGCRFFDSIVQARYATSRKDFRAMLLREGVREELQRPPRVADCIRGLTTEPEFGDARERYEVLCDFVHHNLGSSAAAARGNSIASAAISKGGGVLLMNAPGPFTHYEYPVPAQAKIAVDGTAAGFLKDAKGCVRWANESPEGPYSPAMIKAMTGTDLGLGTVILPHAVLRTERVGRNELCPCGSGRKYKKCCLQ